MACLQQFVRKNTKKGRHAPEKTVFSAGCATAAPLDVIVQYTAFIYCFCGSPFPRRLLADCAALRGCAFGAVVLRLCAAVRARAAQGAAARGDRGLLEGRLPGPECPRA
jgi:hypothetical protein